MTLADFERHDTISTAVIEATIMEEATVEGFFNDLSKNLKKLLESITRYISEDLVDRFKDMLENVVGKRITDESKYNIRILNTKVVRNIPFKDYAMATVQGTSTFTLRIDKISEWAVEALNFKKDWQDAEEQFRVYTAEFLADEDVRKSFGAMNVVDDVVMRKYTELNDALGKFVVNTKTPMTTIAALFGNSDGIKAYVNACNKILKVDLYNEVKEAHKQLRILKKRLDLVLEVAESEPITQEALKSFAEQTKRMADITSLLGKIYFVSNEMISYSEFIIAGIQKELNKK